MDKQELIALAERVEKLEGPCRETDALVHRAVYPDQLIMTDAGGYKGERPVRHTPIGALEWNNWADIADLIQAPRYNASIDAAMTLVPENYMLNRLSDIAADGLNLCELIAVDGPDAISFGTSSHATAICAASLRAIASQEGE